MIYFCAKFGNHLIVGSTVLMASKLSESEVPNSHDESKGL